MATDDLDNRSSHLSEDAIYADFDDIEHREYVLSMAFDELSQNVLLFPELLKANSILDIGMGKGALGSLLRKRGFSKRIVGIDMREYEERKGYQAYDRLELGRPAEEIIQSGLKEESFDYVICMSPGRELLEWLILNKDSIPLRQRAKLFIATELNPQTTTNFLISHGNSYIVKNILFYEAPSQK